MCVESKSALNLGANVTVSLSGLEPLAGVVKWKEDDCYGIGFNRVLAVNELMSFLQQQQRLERSCANG
jgi:hypothetical protein